MLSFHRAELSDAHSITELVNAAYRGEPKSLCWTSEYDLLDGLQITTPEVAAIIKRDDAFLLVGVLRDQIVATIACEHQENTAKFSLIAVKPSLQNKGYGREMIRAAEAITTRAWRVAGFYMSVITLRTELIEFYERLGFQRSGQFEEFPENPKVWQPKVPSLALEYLVKLTRR